MICCEKSVSTNNLFVFQEFNDLIGCKQNQFGFFRCFIGIIDIGKALDLTGVCLFIEIPWGSHALFTYLDWLIDKDFKKFSFSQSGLSLPDNKVSELYLDARWNQQRRSRKTGEAGFQRAE